jgi:DNA-binding NarL/FixJ family response regulator
MKVRKSRNYFVVSKHTDRKFGYIWFIVIPRAMRKHEVQNARARPLKVLSKRELTIIQMMCREMTNQEMADALFISRCTIMRHKQNIKEKTGARSVIGICLYALRLGLVPQGFFQESP